ncbi:MAG TPA: YebC/PmpR family DNA-binding transcriptional regulator, partial [Candidatus Gracilibacteria bacterium]|nr:YebC/PmpR family DNA-binding transcriptional regulator [Candidatus Gracilibacteria bacterium]
AFESAEVAFIPKQTVKLTTKDDAEKALSLIEALEENDDVSDVYANFEIDDSIIGQLES